MKSPILFFATTLLACVAQPALAADGGEQDVPDQFRDDFLRLCDLSATAVNRAGNNQPFFVDSYAVRALCVGYDITGNARYLDAAREWSDQMVRYQERMIPPGAYYMHYNRKPGSTNGDWYAADSSSIAMALLATSVRCPRADRERLLASAEKFADLVINRYVQPDGGVSDGLWHQSTNSWWCSSGLFGSLDFLLYANTGQKRYLDTALGVADWLNHCDLSADQPFPLRQQGPAMPMYVMECYSAGWENMIKDAAREKVARAQVTWCLDWMLKQQAAPIEQRIVQSLRPPRMLVKPEHPPEETVQGPWAISSGWGMKFGGLPFHEYIFSRRLPQDGKLTAAGDEEVDRLRKYVFAGKPKFTQLTVFMMMSYAERLEPGGIYK